MKNSGCLLGHLLSLGVKDQRLAYPVQDFMFLFVIRARGSHHAEVSSIFRTLVRG